MSLYQKIADIGGKYIAKNKLFKYGFNFSPMYRRSTGRILYVSKDLKEVTVRVKISYKNRNYVNSIFGGSLFASVDPIPMVQLINILGEDYVVWDKSAEIFFKRPAKEHVYATFTFIEDQLDEIKNKVKEQQETEYIQETFLTNKAGTIIYCVVQKTIYIANKAYFKEKRKKRKNTTGSILF